MVRGVVNLPNGSGRTVRVGVFARGGKADEAKAAGADVVGAEDLVEKVNKGEIDFDRCIATPDMMPLVGRLGKVLGPRGIMPNPKVGTVTMDVTNAVKGAKGGSVEFRVEKAGIVQAGVGKASFTEDKLVENIKAFADAVQKAKPAGRQRPLHQPRGDLVDHGPRGQGRNPEPVRYRRCALSRISGPFSLVIIAKKPLGKAAVEGLNEAHRACRPNLSARLCASLQTYGDRNLFLLETRLGALKGRSPMPLRM